MEKKANKKLCLQTIEQICSNLSYDSDTPFCREIQQHLNQCSRCCAYVDSLKKTVYLYQNLIEEVPGAIDNRLWKVLKLKKPHDRIKGGH